MKNLYCIVLIIFSLATISCGLDREQEDIYTIGFVQAMTTDNWRKEMNRAMKVEASMHPNLNF